MKSSLVLAIDQGTTGSTALLLTRTGEVRGRGYAELPQHFPKPGWVEHDPEAIWKSALTAVRGALRDAGAGARQIAAIGITNQRETTILWDRRTGKPIAPAIVWQDGRTADRCRALRRAGHAAGIRSRTGLVIDPYFSATKVEWLLQHVRGARTLQKKGRLAFGTVDSWLVWKLTGGAVHATDPTNASRTMLYHIGRLQWDDVLLDRFGVTLDMLPEVRPSSGNFGVTRGVPGLPNDIPIAGIAGDQQAAMFGQGCVTPGESKNTYGTGCFFLLQTGKTRIASRSGLITTVACGPRGEATYALEGSVFMAGAAIQWLRDGMRLLKTADESEALAASVPDSGGVVMVPAFVGLGAPYWRPDVRGALLGLTRGTKREHIVRATLESLAFQSRDLVTAMQRDVGRRAIRSRMKVLRVDGGASANDFLMQYQADLLGMRVERPAVIETTALGAGMLAGLAVGFWNSHKDLARARRIQKVFRPKRTRPWREAEYKRWQDAVRTLVTDW
jgi:glycerol kinase